ncbi:hypothetical protein ABZ671_01220 [Micromonospora sp. NPDC006766]|uniref:hypothetical protein n=1 Tax=Micromonospora sp. NPDC006766 TaxID=3154778 RepID=UPI0033DED23B
MDVQTIRAKIAALETLADPNRATTPEHERAAAQRMLDRFRKLLAEQTAVAGSSYTPYDRWYGEKYAGTRHLPLTDIAKLIRAEVKLARKLAKMTATPGAVKVADPIGDAPTGIKVSVRTRHGNSIDVRLTNIPDEWGWTEEPDDSYIDRRYRLVPTPALQAFARAIKEVMDSYNYDGSDVQTDYFDKRFYGGVSNEWGLHLA